MLRTLVSCVAWLVLVGGCGGEEPAASPEPAGDVLATAAERVGEAGTFAFTAAYTRELPGREVERYAQLSGAVDVATGSGRMEVDLSAILEGSPAENPLGEPVLLLWTPRGLTARAAREPSETMPRERARESGGLLGRLPDEPAGLVNLLRQAQDVRRLGADRIDGRTTERFGFEVDARRAAAAGAPAELTVAFASALYGPRLAMETWIDADGFPRRIVYAVRLEPLRAEDGRVILPARTVRATYDLDAFGEPLSGAS